MLVNTTELFSSIIVIATQTISAIGLQCGDVKTQTLLPIRNNPINTPNFIFLF